ncbi:MAG: HEPN domain-containing protein [Planctomycetes bacterium]|nr:HEPN domain-containing protein [Planctomycetota bacterium]
MSRLLQPNGDDYPEAAKKHLDDGEVLLANGRSDGAGYHAGYVVECVLKTVIVVEKGSAPFVHGLSQLGQDAQRLAALPGAKTARYVPRRTAGHIIYDPTSGWRETLRYRAPAALAPAAASDWLGEAQAVYLSTVVPMQMDGVI